MKISHMPKACGVYQITSPSGKYYIGRSENMHRRMQGHINDAKRKEHYNYKLKAAFKKYGHKMTCKVLALADKEHVAYLETYYINLFFGDRNCMNLAIDPVGCDKSINRDAKTSGYFVSYWTRGIVKIDSLGGWAKQLGKSYGWRGSKIPKKSSKRAVFQTIEECELWLKQMDCIVICDIAESLRPKKKLKPITPDHVLKARKKRDAYKWGYHIKYPSGRVTLARNRQELKRYSMIDGYKRRRFGQPWPAESNITPSKQVIGVSVNGEKKVWPSIGSCAREINKSCMTVVRHCAGKRHQTENGWKLSFYGT